MTKPRAGPTKDLLRGLAIHLSRSWWVFAFAAICLFLHLLAERAHGEQRLRLQELYRARLDQRDHWRRQEQMWALRAINRENPKWIDLVLRSELGVCPKGAIKVLFCTKCEAKSHLEIPQQ